MIHHGTDVLLFRGSITAKTFYLQNMDILFSLSGIVPREQLFQRSCRINSIPSQSFPCSFYSFLFTILSIINYHKDLCEQKVELEHARKCEIGCCLTNSHIITLLFSPKYLNMLGRCFLSPFSVFFYSTVRKPVRMTIQRSYTFPASPAGHSNRQSLISFPF